MNSERSKLFIIAGIGFLAVLIVVIIVVSFFMGPEDSQTEPLPTPSTVEEVASPPPVTLPINSKSREIYSPEYIDEAEKQNSADNTKLSRDALVSKMIDTLPYEGSLIRVTYSIADNSVTVSLDSNNTASANNEFDQFLKRNNIEDRSWIQSLVIQSK